MPAVKLANTVSTKTIVHNLSRIYRFCGASRFSVALHSMFVDDYVRTVIKSRNARLSALLHDAHEAFIGDIPKPLVDALTKEKCKPFLDTVEEIDTAIQEHFSFNWACPDLIAEADEICSAFEVLYVFGSLPYIKLNTKTTEAAMNLLPTFRALVEEVGDIDDFQQVKAAFGMRLLSCL